MLIVLKIKILEKYREKNRAFLGNILNKITSNFLFLKDMQKNKAGVSVGKWLSLDV